MNRPSPGAKVGGPKNGKNGFGRGNRGSNRGDNPKPGIGEGNGLLGGAPGGGGRNGTILFAPGSWLGLPGIKLDGGAGGGGATGGTRAGSGIAGIELVSLH